MTTKKMYYGNIKNNDIANGVGVRVTLFVSGCNHHCKGCFNPETWDFTYGQEFTKDTEKEIIEMMKPVQISGLTLLGGEPMEHMSSLTDLLINVKSHYPKKDIWCYTGYTWEELMDSMTNETSIFLQYIDTLVDGPFVEELKSLSLQYRGSSNQRIIDVHRSLREGKIIIREEFK